MPSPIARHADPRPQVRTPSSTANSGSGVALRSLRSDAFVVRGPRTGWRYEFSANTPVQSVAAQDAELLVATGMFKFERDARR